MKRFEQWLLIVVVLAGRVCTFGSALVAQRRQAAQGLVEYGVILVLIAIVVVGGITLTGRRISSTYSDIDCTLAGNVGQGGGSTTSCTTP